MSVNSFTAKSWNRPGGITSLPTSATQWWMPTSTNGHQLILNDVLESFNSPASLNFLRDITGDLEVRKVEFQATYYASGHFLKLHNDNAKAGDDRRYACVLGLTKDWQSDWGGLLQFVEDGQVTLSCTPSFNSCVIFKVPRDHQVSYVAPFAGKPRYSLTGWMRAD